MLRVRGDSFGFTKPIEASFQAITIFSDVWRLTVPICVAGGGGGGGAVAAPVGGAAAGGGAAPAEEEKKEEKKEVSR